MHLLCALLMILLVHGCSSKRVYSQEEKEFRVNMVKQGLDPDTGETVAQSQRRKQQNAANFARDMSNLSTNMSRQYANIESASRGSSVAEDRSRAERNTRFASGVAERSDDSDTSASRRARETERKAEAKREEARAETKRKQEQVVQVRNKEESTRNDAERVAEEKVKKQQEAADLKAQQESDRKRSEAEAKSKAERDRADRERAAVAEVARKKAEREKKEQDEKAAKANFFSRLERGIKLAARNCPGGEGKHYIVGNRPRVKPEVVSCIDVSYVATCSGAQQGISGVAKNFVGVGTDCFFGDTAEVSPTPACKANEVKVSVTKVKACGS